MSEEITVEPDDSEVLTERYVDPDTGGVYELKMTKADAEELAKFLGLRRCDEE